MNVILLAAAFVSLIAPTKAPITLNVNAKSGDVIVGEKSFRVTVQSNNPVTQVEFYVDTELRDSDTSTPYEFRFDTLNEQDGPIKVRFKAYTSENQTGETTLSLTIDNGVAKGAQFHIDKGNEYLAESKWQDAVNEGRIALKADEKSNPARIVLARANLGLGIYDKAQKYAEDAVAQDSNDAQALSLLSVINLQKAFRTVAREGSDAGDAMNTIRDALKTAVESRRKALDLEVDRLPATTKENAVANSDTMLRAGRYSLAINTLTSLFEADPTNNAVANRLAYAQMRAGRTRDVALTLANVKKFGQLDAYGYAIASVIAADSGDTKESDDAMREAILADSENMGVRTAQAYIALKRNQTQTLSRLVTDLAREQAQRADVNFFISALSNNLQQFSNGRRYFERAVMAEPAYPDIYIEQANYSIGLSQKGQLEQKDLDRQYANAKMMYETAILARPESAEAFSGLSAVLLLQKNPGEALKMANAAVNAQPQYAGGYYALSAAMQAAAGVNRGQSSQLLAGSKAAADKAGQLDRKNLSGRSIPTALAVWKYLNGPGRPPIISAPR